MEPFRSSLPAPSGAALPYRAIIPAAALCLFGALTSLWLWDPLAYFRFLRALGLDPFRFPFLDLHAILAAAECARQGIDVYVVIPCDVLNRPHVYSPLWLSLTPAVLGMQDVPWLGIVLDGTFILSLAFVIRPRSASELVVCGLAVFSPMTILALERANNDVVIFLLLACAAVLYSRSRPRRLGAYALFLLAGLLKFYPLALLAFIGRERGRSVLLLAAAAASILLLFWLREARELREMLASVPSPSYFANTFSAENLPFGLARSLPDLPFLSPSAIGLALLAALMAATLLQTRRNVQLFDAVAGDAGYEAAFLAVGSLVITACFFAGKNIEYRGIYLLFVLPGFFRLHRSLADAGARGVASTIIGAIVFVMWSTSIRHAARAAAHLLLGEDQFGVLIAVAAWLAREFAWWWLIAGLASIVVLHGRQLPLMRGTLARLRLAPST